LILTPLPPTAAFTTPLLTPRLLFHTHAYYHTLRDVALHCAHCLPLCTGYPCVCCGLLRFAFGWTWLVAAALNHTRAGPLHRVYTDAAPTTPYYTPHTLRFVDCGCCLRRMFHHVWPASSAVRCGYWFVAVGSNSVHHVLGQHFTICAASARCPYHPFPCATDAHLTCRRRIVWRSRCEQVKS